MLATGNERCPVKFLEKPVLMRPPSLKQSGPLYLRPLEKTKRDVWFSTQPVGVNKIISYVKELDIGRTGVHKQAVHQPVSVKLRCINFRKLVSLTTKSLQ